jgi:hypothetical protein
MADEWYYGRENEIHGPFTTVQLKELAAAGIIQLTDTIWKNDIPTGVAAAKVKQLFSEDQIRARAASVSAPVVVEAEPEPEPAVSETLQAPEADEPAPDTVSTDEDAKEDSAEIEAKRTLSYSERPKRVVQTSGAIILSQDGKDVRFRKKCIKCGQEDRSRTTMPIRPGTTRVGFYCPKCRKLQPVLIQSC